MQELMQEHLARTRAPTPFLKLLGGGLYLMGGIFNPNVTKSLLADGPMFELCSTHARTNWNPNTAFP